jgi:hypothetical protein
VTRHHIVIGLGCIGFTLTAGSLGAQSSKRADGVEGLPVVSHAQAGRGAQPAEAPEQAVEARATLDRSAVWVADRFTYTLQLTCRRSADILTDDVSRDKLRLDGPEIVGVDMTREDRGNGVTVYRIAYHLTTYHLDPPIQKIGEMNVRYYVRRAGQRVEDATPAGEVSVPGKVVTVRSLLPDAQDTAAFRDGRPPAPRRTIVAMLQPIGLGLVIVSIVPAGVWASVLIGRTRRTRVQRSARLVRHDERASLEALRSIDVTTDAGRREAYDRVSALVRQHLRDAFGMPATALTAAEIGPALTARGKDVPIDLVTSLLEACDRARYGSADALGSADACRHAIEHAEQVIAAAR